MFQRGAGWLAVFAVSVSGCFVGASGAILAHSAGPRMVEEAVSVGVPLRRGDFGRAEGALEGAIGQRLDTPGRSLRASLRGSYQGQPLGWRGPGFRAGWLLGASLDLLWIDDYRAQVSETIHLGGSLYAPTGENRGFGFSFEGFVGAAQSPTTSGDPSPTLPDGVVGGAILRAWYDIYSPDSGSGSSSHGAGLLGRANVPRRR